MVGGALCHTASWLEVISALHFPVPQIKCENIFNALWDQSYFNVNVTGNKVSSQNYDSRPCAVTEEFVK